MQKSFGEVVGMEPVVPSLPDKVACEACGTSIDCANSIEVRGVPLCVDCAKEKGWIRCADCNETTDNFMCDEGDYYCESCYGERFVSCYGCDNTIAIDDATVCARGRSYCSDCYNENFAKCEACGCEVKADHVCSSSDGTSYCEDCYSELFTSCEACSDEISRDDVIYVRDCAYCSGCAPSDDHAEWEYGSFRPSAMFREIRSQRKFGVELETSACPDHADLEGKTCFDCREDGSISGMEFTSPVLSSDAGLAAIRTFCTLAKEHEFETNRDCGFHAHFNVRDLSAGQKRSVAYAYLKTYKVWSAFVSVARRDNSYCRPVGWGRASLGTLVDEDTWRDFSIYTEQYVWMNLRAYSRHGTFEMRLHGATLDPIKICNWVKAHARFIDWAASKTFDEIDEIFNGTIKSKFRALTTIWADTDLAEYYKNRAVEFGTDLTLAPSQKVAI